MDNRITKRRLSDFFAYEWFAVILAVLLFIAGWEVLYSFIKVTPTPGQSFKYYYDEGVTPAANTKLYDVTRYSISYDVLLYSSESVSEEYDILSDRIPVAEGDVIFANASKEVKLEDLTTGNYCRAKMVIDSYWVFSLDELLSSAQNYLKSTFFKDEYKSIALSDNEYTADKIDDNKVRQVFLERQKGDNRFRTNAQKEQGILKEKERVSRLCLEVCDFGFFMNYAKTECPELLYRYTKYEQAYYIAKNENNSSDIQTFEPAYNNNLSVRNMAPYGINLSALKGGTNASELVRLEGKDNSDGVVMMAFDFVREQPHLQYETISFMNSIIRECSNILDK